MVPFPPLDSPKPSFKPLSEAFAAKRGDGGSVPCVGQVLGRLSALNLPAPAPLPSRMKPWNTKHICGHLAFRRATEGRRVRGKMWGCQEGDKKPGGCLVPLLPPPPGGGLPHAMSWRTSPVPGGPLSPAAASRRISGRSTISRRLKSNGLLPQGSKNLPVPREVLNIYVSNRISVFGAALSVQYACRAAAS